MKVERNFKCKECGDVFTATYDTRNKKVINHFSCKCGKIEISFPGVNHYLINKGEDLLEHLSDEEKNIRTEFYSEDYLAIPEDLKKLMERSDELGNRINDLNKPGEYYSNISKENAYFELSGLSQRGEYLEISVKGTFFDEYSWSTHDPERAIKDFRASLKRFINLEEKVLADEINLNDGCSIWNNEDLKWSYSERTPISLYDYKFKC